MIKFNKFFNILALHWAFFGGIICMEKDYNLRRNDSFINLDPHTGKRITDSGRFIEKGEGSTSSSSAAYMKRSNTTNNTTYERSRLRTTTNEIQKKEWPQQPWMNRHIEPMVRPVPLPFFSDNLTVTYKSPSLSSLANYGPTKEMVFVKDQSKIKKKKIVDPEDSNNFINKKWIKNDPIKKFDEIMGKKENKKRSIMGILKQMLFGTKNKQKHVKEESKLGRSKSSKDIQVRASEGSVLPRSTLRKQQLMTGDDTKTRAARINSAQGNVLLPRSASTDEIRRKEDRMDLMWQNQRRVLSHYLDEKLK